MAQLRGAPRRLRLDNGPEFISAALRQWAQQHGVTLIHIQPGNPTQGSTPISRTVVKELQTF
ncbi:hypothetical protein XAB3213_1180004 [Xanthomonas citri pv. bilvae]|nr:hypothetical protein XAB3213_1180004 [Xanthomonas citri pv. bilvae]